MIASKLVMCHIVSNLKIERNFMKKIVLGIAIILSTSSFASTLERQSEYADQVESDTHDERLENITAGIPVVLYCNTLGVAEIIRAGFDDTWANFANGLKEINIGKPDAEKTNLENFWAGLDELKKVRITNEYNRLLSAREESYGEEGYCKSAMQRLATDLGATGQEIAESTQNFIQTLLNNKGKDTNQ